MDAQAGCGKKMLLGMATFHSEMITVRVALNISSGDRAAGYPPCV